MWAPDPCVPTDRTPIDQIWTDYLAVMCHFEDEDGPKVLRLHLVHDELLAP